MNIKKLNEELKKYLDESKQTITEISAELANVVASKRQQQLDKLQQKLNKARNYADNKIKQTKENAKDRIVQIRNRIRLILSDKPGIEDIPDGIFVNNRDSLIKVIYLPFKKQQKVDNEQVTDWGYFGLSDDPRYAPVIVFSLDEFYDKWTSPKWNNLWIGSQYNFTDELDFWETALQVVEQKYGDNEEEIKVKEIKAKRSEYNKKQRAEKKAQKLADSKPFDKFLQELKDEYGSGYIAQDVYGDAFVYKNKPTFVPTVDGYQGNEEIYEPGYWEGTRLSNKNYEGNLNKAYKDQYRKPVPSNDEAIWSF